MIISGDDWKAQLKSALDRGAQTAHLQNVTLTAADHDAFSLASDSTHPRMENLREMLHAEPAHHAWRDICVLATRTGPVAIDYANEHLSRHWPTPWSAIDTSFVQLHALYLDGCSVAPGAWEMLLASPFATVQELGVRRSGLSGEPLERLLETTAIAHNVTHLIITRESLTEADLAAFAHSLGGLALRHLSLPDNGITCAALKALCRAEQARLSSLDLSGNPIRPKGVNALVAWKRYRGCAIDNLYMDCDTLSSVTIRKLSDTFNLFKSARLMAKMYKVDLTNIVHNFDMADHVNLQGSKDDIIAEFFDTYHAYWDMGCGSRYTGPGWS